MNLVDKTDERAALIQEIQHNLSERYRSILHKRNSGIRQVADVMQPQGVVDSAETGDVGNQAEMNMDLSAMQATELRKIEEALEAIRRKTFGFCFECGDEISTARLRALNFAVRCKDCEDAREKAAEIQARFEKKRGRGR